MISEQSAVVACVRKEKDHAADSAVHPFAFDPSLKGLEITGARLGFDGNGQSRPGKDGIPRAQIAASDWDLASPGEAG